MLKKGNTTVGGKNAKFVWEERIMFDFWAFLWHYFCAFELRCKYDNCDMNALKYVNDGERAIHLFKSWYRYKQNFLGVWYLGTLSIAVLNAN